jgi:soluble lytic murein transglycosylase
MRRSTTIERPGPRAPAAGTGRPARRRRRRALPWGIAFVLLAAFGVSWFLVHQAMPGWYARLWYPLRYEQTIRTEAARNQLDPALVAAVINTESGFVPDSRSSEGAVGLMQLLPATARFVAEQPGRPSPSPDALGDPDANIAYGSRYLRYLIDRYGTVDLALAAYNGGESNVSRWLERARASGRTMRIPDDIPFPETRGFVRRVEHAVPIYRRAYGDQLFTPSREGVKG